MSTLLSSLQQAVRRLRRSPGFATTALLTLAVGIGANTAIFSLINGILVKPLPYHEPESLVALWHTAPGLGFDELNQSPATYLTYRAESRLLEDVGIYDDQTITVSGGEQPEEVPALMVTDGVLPILGVQPQMGRLFGPDDDAVGAAPTAMISHGYWQRAFGGNPGIVGQTLSLDGTITEIVGVLPENFQFLEEDPAVLFPARFDPSEIFFGQFNYEGVGRMNPGVTPEQVARELQPLINVSLERFPGPITQSMVDQAQFGQLVRPLKDEVVGDLGTVLWLLMGTVTIVLLIACANVANLFLIRAEGRIRDIAVRTAIGASRSHVAGQFLGESVVLGAAGGLLGVLLAWGGIRVLVALGPPLPRLAEVELSPLVLLFALTVSIFSGLLFGSIALLRYGRPKLSVALKEGLRGSTSGRERHRAQSALVVSQVALALILLIGAGLLVRTFAELRQVEPGFQAPEELTTFRVSIPSAVVDEPARVATLLEEINRRLAELPGTISVGASSSITMDGYQSNDPVFLEDQPVEPGQLPPIRRLKSVLPGYFETMQSRLVVGRTFTWDDLHSRADVAMVTEDFARENWGDPAAALGKRISQPDTEMRLRWRSIVGVVGEEHDDGVDQEAVPIVYWPAISQNADGTEQAARTMSFVLRSRPGSEVGLASRLQQAVWSAHPSLPLANIRTVAEIQRESMERTSFALVMLGIASVVALFLGAVGLYGTISYSVTQRVREIGVRMALGARQNDVSRMILTQGMLLTGAGVVVGMLGAIALTRLMGALLFGVQPTDALTFVTVAALLGCVALLASWIPARRASALDPGTTLRQE